MRILAAATVIAGFSVPAAWAGEFSILPGFSLSQVWSDNVYGTETDRKNDTSTVLRPSLGFDYKGEDSRQSLSYGLAAELYWRNPGANAFSHLGDYTSSVTFSPRFSTAFTERISYSPGTTTALFPGAAAEPELFRVKTLRNATELTPLIRLTERTDLKLRSRFLLQKVDTRAVTVSGVTISNMYDAGEDVEIDHRLTEKDTVTPTASVDYYWFSGAADTIGAGGALAWSRKWTPTIDSSVGAGVIRLIARGGGTDSTNVTAAASVGFTLSPWSLVFSYTRAIYAGSGLSTAVNTDSAAMDASYALGEKWVFRVTPGYFRSSGGTSGATLSGAYVGSSASYQILPWLAASAGYDYRYQNSQKLVGYTFSRNLVILTLSVVPPPSWASSLTY